MFLAVPDNYVHGEKHDPPYVQDDPSIVAKVINGGAAYDPVKYYKLNFAGPNNIPSITAEVRIKPGTRNQIRAVEEVELEVGGLVVGQGEVEV